MTTANLGEYEDWATSNNDLTWGNDELLDTAKFLLAVTTPSLPASIHKDLPLYLDSGVSTHISCVHSDFSSYKSIELQTITGVGNLLVSAIGLGTVEILIPNTSMCLCLWNVLYAPDAGVQYVSY